MSRKFYAKAKRIAAPGKGSAPGTTSAPQQTGNIGKLKIIGFLVLATGLAGGVYIAAHADKAAQIAHAEVAAVTVVEVCGIAYLVKTLPFLFLFALRPCVVGKEQFFIH